MEKIWYRISEVIGRCGGDEKTEWPRRTDKSRTLVEDWKIMHIAYFMLLLLINLFHKPATVVHSAFNQSFYTFTHYFIYLHSLFHFFLVLYFFINLKLNLFWGHHWIIFYSGFLTLCYFTILFSQHLFHSENLFKI